MLATRRRGLFAIGLLGAVLASGARGDDAAVPKIAAIVTVYYHNSHADAIVSRLLQSHTLDGRGEFPKLKLVSLYTDQVPANDKSRTLAQQHGFKIYDNVADTLTLGTGALAVDGVLLICEHGDYPDSETGSTVFPKRRLFAEVAKTFEASGRSVPVFCDKHLADNWTDAKWLYDESQRLKVPLMAGSCLPQLWRYPEANVQRDARLKEIVAVSYHRLDVYGFHALEAIQSLVERRAGGETGIVAATCLEGDAVWEAGQRGLYDKSLLDAALAKLKERPIPAGKTLRELTPHPELFVIEYQDGLRASVLTANYAIADWTAAWRYADDNRVEATCFWTQEARPVMHFTYLVQGIEQMFHTGQPAWPAERTLMTSGVLDSLLISRKQGGQRLETPHLVFPYRTDWEWRQPPPPPPGRPFDQQ